MTSPARTDSLVVSRVLSASADRVFDWLTEPEKLARWMTPRGSVSAEADARPGGRLFIVMSDGQMRIEHRGEFLVVDRPSRLVFTWNSPFTDGDSVVTIDLAASGERTLLTLRHERLPDGAAQSHSSGWGSMLDRLAIQLEAEG